MSRIDIPRHGGKSRKLCRFFGTRVLALEHFREIDASTDGKTCLEDLENW